MDAHTVTNGDNGARVAVGAAGTVIISVGTIVPEVVIGFDVELVVRGTGAALPRWDVDPVL
jgi:hypothetical protein